MAIIIRLNQSITDESAPKIPEIITSGTFSGDLTMTDAALGGQPWPLTNVSGAWQLQDGGITSTGGSLILNDLPGDISVEFTIKSLHAAGRLVVSSRADSISGANREVIEINSDGSVRFNPRVGGAQQTEPYSAAGVVKAGSVVTFSTVGNAVQVLVDGDVVAEQNASVPAGGTFYLSSYQMTAGLVVDDLLITTV